MRVIAGSARRLLLKAPKGDSTRPTTDRIKETLFNIISPELYDANFLDLFAGSGGIGIEALSRGAKFSVFVEKDRSAASCIADNLLHTKFENSSKLFNTDVFNAIRKLSGKYCFDIVFMDPPYETDYIEKALQELKLSNIINKDSIIICESLIHKDFGFAEDYGYDITRIKEYKSNKHVFLRLK